MSRGKLVEFLKSKLMVGSLSVPTYSGHRTIGDMIEVEVINELSQNYNIVEGKSKRSIDDFSIGNDLYDVKTHHENEGGFSMPNLISVKRLKGVLEDESKTLSYVFVDYTRNDDEVKITDVHIKYVWELDWSMLSIGALGKGQLQIKDANKELVFTDIGRDEWFKILKVKVLEFYQKELTKIGKEIDLWNI